MIRLAALMAFALIVGCAKGQQHEVPFDVGAYAAKSISGPIPGAVPDDGINDTPGVQALFDSAAACSANEIVLPAGNFLLGNARNDSQYTCAVVIRNLRNCVIRGSGGTKFTASASGSPVAGFGFFRVEQCENVTFSGFEIDGTGIAVTTGANRLNGIVCINFDANNTAIDLPVANRGLEFHHLYIHDSGGGISVVRRNMALADTPMTEGLSVHDCRMVNLLGVDHGVTCARTRNAIIYNNSFVNNIPTVTPQDNMAVDASSGAEVVHVYNNYVRGFVFGMKCESVANAGALGNEVRASKRVLFQNNRLEEIGDPSLLAWPGASGGGTYGIKLNGIDCAAIGNTVTARTIGTTSGGLGFGIIAANTHGQNGLETVDSNAITGAQYGIMHNTTIADVPGNSATIKNNSIYSATSYGILAQRNSLTDSNRIFGAGKSAIVIQPPIKNTFVTNNFAYNCASINNDVIPNKCVFYQEGTGYHGFFTFQGNVIVDERATSAADYGYFFRAGTVLSNSYTFAPGRSTGLLVGISYDPYISVAVP